MILHKNQKIYLWSIPLLYVGVGLYTLLGTFLGNWAIETPFNFYYRVDSYSITRAIFLLFEASFFFLVGWRISYNLSNKKLLQDTSIRLNRKTRNIFFLLNIASIIVILGTYEWDYLFDHIGYANYSNRNDFLNKLYYIFFPISVFSLAFLRNKMVKKTLFSLHFLLLLSIGTRLLGILFFLYALGIFFRDNYKLSRKLILILFLSFYFFVWTLSIRNYKEQGLVNNVKYIPQISNVIKNSFEGINYIASFSVYGLAYSIENKKGDKYSFWVSLSPLPLKYHNKERLLESQRLLGTSPMSSIAIIYSIGYLYFVLFYSLLGMILFYISKHLNGYSIISIFSIGVFILASILSIQYNLRGFSRLLYLCGLLSLVKRLKFNWK